MDVPFCSLIVVNFNGRKYLDSCLRSLERLDYPATRFEIVVVDNGSDDGSEVEARLRHPNIRVLPNSKNNFAAALNLGVRSTQGKYVAFCNNDIFLEPDWLKELVATLEDNERAGCAGGKILLEDGRINSVGHRALPEFYWDDEGYGEKDVGQYDKAREVDGLCWAAVLFRRACLEDLGSIDEDYVMYYEDVDTSTVCLQRGWSNLYQPRAVTAHVLHGSSDTPLFAEFFCDRSRLIYVAKHHPERLAETIRTSRYITRGDREALYDAMPITLRKLVQSHPDSVARETLREVADALIPVFGALGVDHLFARLQVIMGYRKMSFGIYDHAAHMIGGGQKYGCVMAAALEDRYEVTIISNRPVNNSQLAEWYDVPLRRTQVQTVPLPYFEATQRYIDASAVIDGMPNPFEPVSEVSQCFDVFVNMNMLTMVEPRSPFSVFVCHFPDTMRPVHFCVNKYSCVIVNSRYTLSWTRARWDIEPILVLYPPVDMPDVQARKERIILSVARYEYSGSKKQIELIEAFKMLCERQPELMAGWRLVLVGGSIPDNPYLERVQQAAARSGAPVEVCVNVPFEELQQHYARAAIFWHACGLEEENPHLIEHFGMTTVEAMLYGCVPIVINGGGQKEIVEQGLSGYRFNTIDELCDRTIQVVATPDLAESLREGALNRARQFSRERFDDSVKAFFSAIEEEYCTIQLPDPRDVLQNRRPENLFYSPVARRPTTASSLPASPVRR